MESPEEHAANFGTGPVRAGLDFEHARLEEFLAARIEGFEGPLEVQQFKGGQSNPTYLLTTPARRYVLRRKPPGPLLPSAHAIDREYRAISSLGARKFPVPDALVYCEDDTVIGTPFYVMVHVDGRVFWNPGLPDAEPGTRRAVYDSMNAAIARLHSFDPAELGLADYGKGENYVARQIARWTRQYVASKTDNIAAMERLAIWLPEHLPPPMPARLVHGDYRIDNLIFARDTNSVAAVIDWELSTLGDPLADFTYHLMTWEMPHGAEFGTLKGLDLAAAGIPSRDEYAESYARHTGFDPRPYMDLYLAYNFFRLAAIAQGIVGRVRDGTAANRNAAAMANAVRPLAETAAAFARRAGMAG